MARDVYETAEKLRALAEHPTTPEHEAALAQAMFEAYTARHQIAPEDLPVRPQTAAEFWAWLRQVEQQRRALEAENARQTAAVAALVAEAERHEIEYLRRLPQAKREAQLRQLSPAKRAHYRRQFELLCQASASRRRERRRKETTHE